MSTTVRRTGRIVTLFVFVSLAYAPLGCGEDTTSGGASDDPDEKIRADDIPEDPPSTDQFDDLDRDRDRVGAPPPLDPATAPELPGDDSEGTNPPLHPPSAPELDGNDDYETTDPDYPVGEFDDVIEGTDGSSEDGSSDDGSTGSDDDTSDESTGDGSTDDGSKGSETDSGEDTSGSDPGLCVSGDDTINPMLPTASGTYGCTRTRGYWSNHHERATAPGCRRDWPAPYEEDHRMCDRKLLSIIGSQGSKGLWHRLGAQWLAAVLNTSQASAPPNVASALVDGKQLLTDHVRTIPSKDRKQAERIKNLLDDYNNGIVGPGKCP
jgi:hypothetical protein